MPPTVSTIGVAVAVLHAGEGGVMSVAPRSIEASAPMFERLASEATVGSVPVFVRCPHIMRFSSSVSIIHQSLGLPWLLRKRPHSV